MVIRKNKLIRSGIILQIIFFMIMICLVVNPIKMISAQDYVKNKEIVIKSASELDYPPYCIVTEEGEADGFSVELLREALLREGYDVSFEVGPWNEVKGMLESGEVQVLPLVGRTPEREEIFDFTVPYYSIKGVIFVRDNENRIYSIEDLRDKEIIVMKGDNSEEYIRRINISENIITTNTFEEAFLLLSSGKHDAVIAQSIVGDEIINKLKLSNVKKLELQLEGFTQYFSFAVKEDDKEMLEILNEGLAKVMTDGTYERLVKKWIPKTDSEKISSEDILKYFLTIFLPLLFLISIGFIILFKMELKRRTKDLIKEIKEREYAENNLKKNKSTLLKLNKELIEAKSDLKKKNDELRKTMDDFYTIRVRMAKDIEKGKLEEENKKIKEKLDKFKKE